MLFVLKIFKICPNDSKPDIQNESYLNIYNKSYPSKHTTSPTSYRRLIDVETTLCVYWVPSNWLMNTKHRRIRNLTYHGQRDNFENLFAYGANDVHDAEKRYTKMTSEYHQEIKYPQVFSAKILGRVRTFPFFAIDFVNLKDGVCFPMELYRPQ